MILRVKEKTYQTIIRKALAYGALILMFSLYYLYMSNQFQTMNDELSQELKAKNEIIEKKINVTQKVEKLIYKEAETCVELVGQEKVRSVEIVKNKLVMVFDYDANVEPIFIRYGIMALIKSTPEDVRVSIDLKFIVESKYEI